MRPLTLILLATAATSYTFTNPVNHHILVNLRAGASDNEQDETSEIAITSLRSLGMYAKNSFSKLLGIKQVKGFKSRIWAFFFGEQDGDIGEVDLRRKLSKRRRKISRSKSK